MAKEGRRAKDEVLRDGFNPDKVGQKALGKRELQRAKKQFERELQDTEAEAVLRQEAEKILSERGGGFLDDEEEAENRDADDVKSALQMLKDMRWIYRKVHGRRKLKEMVETDDKQFLAMVKELMKIESALLSAQIRAKESNQGGVQAGQMVFVVLKGLEDETNLKMRVAKANEDAGIIDVLPEGDKADLNQIDRVISMDPDALRDLDVEPEMEEVSTDLAGQAAPEGW